MSSRSNELTILTMSQIRSNGRNANGSIKSTTPSSRQHVRPINPTYRASLPPPEVTSRIAQLHLETRIGENPWHSRRACRLVLRSQSCEQYLPLPQHWTAAASVPTNQTRNQVYFLRRKHLPFHHRNVTHKVLRPRI